ncbi:hypothetical protein ACVWYH_008065 [Bradyrhizobium sp. GM24.11]
MARWIGVVSFASSISGTMARHTATKPFMSVVPRP